MTAFRAILVTGLVFLVVVPAFAQTMLAEAAAAAKAAKATAGQSTVLVVAPAVQPAVKPASTAAPVVKAPSAPADAIRQAVATMMERGLIARMNLSTSLVEHMMPGSVYVSGVVWDGFELDAKQNIVTVISKQRAAETGLPQVTLFESRSGKELASYSAFSGVTIR